MDIHRPLGMLTSVTVRSDSRHINEEINMLTVVHVGPIVALIAGILILVIPRLLNYIVAIYLIIIGLLGLFGEHLV